MNGDEDVGRIFNCHFSPLIKRDENILVSRIDDLQFREAVIKHFAELESHAKDNILLTELASYGTRVFASMAWIDDESGEFATSRQGTVLSASINAAAKKGCDDTIYS